MNKFSQFLIALSAIVVFVASASAQQIHIKTIFIEMPKKGFVDPRSSGQVTGILTPENMQMVLQQLESKSGAEILGEPEVTTIGGRQTQMRATVILTVITNFTFEENSGKSSITPQSAQIEFGPVLDVVPTVSSDGEKINLTTTASLLNFLGYADTKNATAHFATNSAGEQIALPTVSPQFEVKQDSAKITVLDGQTILLMPKSSNKENQNPADEQKVLVVMITPTIVDDTGNRIHPDN
jgi:hypothetical protein